MAGASPAQDCGIALHANERYLSNQSCTICRIMAAAIKAAEVEAHCRTDLWEDNSKGMHTALCTGMTLGRSRSIQDGFP